ncbi:MAG: hypothetical protein ACW98D_20420 [Promethearchaeota archaeon]|jgi:hypothetical protein
MNTKLEMLGDMFNSEDLIQFEINELCIVEYAKIVYIEYINSDIASPLPSIFTWRKKRYLHLLTA